MRKARPLALLALLRGGPMTVPQLHRFLERRFGRHSSFLPDQVLLAKTLTADAAYGHVAIHANVFTLLPKGQAYLEQHPLITLVLEAFSERDERSEPRAALG